MSLPSTSPVMSCLPLRLKTMQLTGDFTGTTHYKLGNQCIKIEWKKHRESQIACTHTLTWAFSFPWSSIIISPMRSSPSVSFLGNSHDTAKSELLRQWTMQRILNVTWSRERKMEASGQHHTHKDNAHVYTDISMYMMYIHVYAM